MQQDSLQLPHQDSLQPPQQDSLQLPHQDLLPRLPLDWSTRPVPRVGLQRALRLAPAFPVAPAAAVLVPGL